MIAAWSGRTRQILEPAALRAAGHNMGTLGALTPICGLIVYGHHAVVTVRRASIGKRVAVIPNRVCPVSNLNEESMVIKGAGEEFERWTVRQALVSGMEFFARHTRMALLAEGIETHAELATLRALGVDLGQGYLFGEPAPAASHRTEKPRYHS